MPRRRYLIAYDISDPVRLRRTCTLMEDHGYRLQYSVFLCDLSPAELVELQARLLATIDPACDSVVRIDLGDSADPRQVVAIGRPPRLPHQGPQIV
jgi:CRISPR-associated protein Cas2